MLDEGGQPLLQLQDEGDQGGVSDVMTENEIKPVRELCRKQRNKMRLTKADETVRVDHHLEGWSKPGGGYKQRRCGDRSCCSS